jgi:cytochrome c peroxidase
MAPGRRHGRRTPAIAPPANAAAIRLGHDLFFEPRLSANGRVGLRYLPSSRRKAFQDGRATGRGLATGTRNTPGLLQYASPALVRLGWRP